MWPDDLGWKAWLGVGLKFVALVALMLAILGDAKVRISLGWLL